MPKTITYTPEQNTDLLMKIEARLNDEGVETAKNAFEKVTSVRDARDVANVIREAVFAEDAARRAAKTVNPKSTTKAAE